MNKEYILFLAGGRWQWPWMSLLVDKGHEIVLIDPNHKPYCSSLAALHFECDVKNTEQILDFISQNNLKISHVTTEQTDVSKIPQSIISEKLGLKNESTITTELFCNKARCREFIIKNQLGHIPVFKSIKTLKELEKFHTNYNKKLILKPTDSQSSRGISFISKNTEKSDLDTLFKNAVQFSPNHECIVEEFIEGEEITIEGISLNGKHQSLTGSSKKHFSPGIASELNYPIEKDDALINQVVIYNNQLVESMGYNNGLTHAEYIINKKSNEFHLVEIACRGGGSLIPSDIVKWVCNFDLYEVLYHATILGKVIELPSRLKIKQEQNHSILYFFDFGEGKVDKIVGVEQCKNHKNVHLIQLEFTEGDLLTSANDDRSRQGFTIIFGKTKKEIENTISYINYNLKVELVND